MTSHRPAAPPTLTEVIHLTDIAMAPTEPIPLAPDSVPIEELESAAAAPPVEPRPMRLADVEAEWRARLVEDLRPALQRWLEAEVRLALQAAMPALGERLLGTLRARLDAEMPELLERALADSHGLPPRER